MTDTQKQKIQEARAHLAVALVQVHPSDDKIIVDHMREAQAALDAALYQQPHNGLTLPTYRHDIRHDSTYEGRGY